MIASEAGRIIERHVGNKALNSKQSEATLNEIWSTVSSGFPLYGLPVSLVILICIIIVVILIAYSVAGKGRGSHAGREEVRRAYRRELARQMARQDADKIKSGQKPRRRWMQW